jgi:hypothetical protein
VLCNLGLRQSQRQRSRFTGRNLSLDKSQYFLLEDDDPLGEPEAL